MNVTQEDVGKHTKSTLRDAVLITFSMIAALLAAEGRMPNPRRVATFVVVFTGLVIVLRLSHDDLAKQMTTAAAIGCGSKLLEVLGKK